MSRSVTKTRLAAPFRMLRELAGLTRRTGSYWLIPLVLALALGSLLVMTGELAAPLIYTLF